MITKQCENCGNQFEVEEQWRNNKRCKSCYFNRPHNPNKTDESTKLIVRQVCLKTAGILLPKRSKAETIIEYMRELERGFWNET